MQSYICKALRDVILVAFIISQLYFIRYMVLLENWFLMGTVLEVNGFAMFSDIIIKKRNKLSCKNCDLF